MLISLRDLATEFFSRDKEMILHRLVEKKVVSMAIELLLTKASPSIATAVRPKSGRINLKK